MTDSALYQQIVLEHYRNPRNRGELDAFTHAADGRNPLCGDSLRLQVRCVGDRIAGLGFSGEACAITTATASMLTELVLDHGRDEIAELQRIFESLVTSGHENRLLGPLNAMRELAGHPARRKCAMLPWATLHAALAGGSHASTEGRPA